MRGLTLDTFNSIMDKTTIKPRLKRELRFVASTAAMPAEAWKDTELFAIKDRNGNKGVLLVEIASGLYVFPYEFKRTNISSVTGRAEAVICDLCKTWQSGSNAGSISFIDAKKATSNVAYLCCADLACSKHVRTQTPAAKVSRAQLRENLDNDQRVERLRTRLEKIMKYVEAEPVKY